MGPQRCSMVVKAHVVTERLFPSCSLYQLNYPGRKMSEVPTNNYIPAAGRSLRIMRRYAADRKTPLWRKCRCSDMCVLEVRYCVFLTLCMSEGSTHDVNITRNAHCMKINLCNSFTKYGHRTLANLQHVPGYHTCLLQ